MRSISIGLLLNAVACLGAAAQTAEFKCPKPGTVVEWANGARTTWVGQEGNFCRRQIKDQKGEEYLQNWYAPTFPARANQSQAFVEQVKAWTLWPLSVGKKLTGRFDGVGSNPGFGPGSWHETVVVEAYEKIDTKIGQFDVFRVTRNEEALSHRYQSTYREWYAPALGVSVKVTFTDNQGTNLTFDVVRVTP